MGVAACRYAAGGARLRLRSGLGPAPTIANHRGAPCKLLRPERPAAVPASGAPKRRGQRGNHGGLPLPRRGGHKGSTFAEADQRLFNTFR
jgi:hypothetical protein